MYVQMASHLADAIGSGKYPVGSLLPPEAALCQLFSASRFTVREAIKLLRSLGMVSTHHGAGSRVVSKQARDERFVYSFESVQDFRQSVGHTRLVNISAEEVVADHDIAAALRCSLGSVLLRIRALRVLVTPKGRSGKPVGLSIVYLPIVYAGILDDIGTSLDETIMVLIERRYGLRTALIEQTIDPYCLEKADAKELRVQPGSLGLRFQRAYIDSRGKAYEYAISIQPADEARLTMTIRARSSTEGSDYTRF